MRRPVISPPFWVGLVREEPGPAVAPPPRVALEVPIAMGRPSDTPPIAEIADPVPLSCPGYEGTLSQVRRSPLRFRCQVGHGYTAEALAYEQEGSVDEAVRIALKVMGERVVLTEKMTLEAMQAGTIAAAATFEERTLEYKRSADVLMDAALMG